MMHLSMPDYNIEMGKIIQLSIIFLNMESNNVGFSPPKQYWEIGSCIVSLEILTTLHSDRENQDIMYS